VNSVITNNNNNNNNNNNKNNNNNNNGVKNSAVSTVSRLRAHPIYRGSILSRSKR
jgi:hypothetical protein